MPRRGCNIYKRKDGRWEARYVKSISTDGTKKYASVYAQSYREAKDKQIQCLQNVHLSKSFDINLSLEDLMWNWLSSISNQVKHSSYVKYESMIRTHLTSGIGKIQVRYLTGSMINQFADEKLHGQNTLSPKSLNDLLVILGMALSYAQDEFGFQKPVIRHVKEKRREMRVLSIAEQHILETYLLQDMNYYKFGILLALYTGLRVGELCALQWDDIRDGNVYVTKTAQRIRQDEKTIVQISTPKTRSSNRVIPIPAFLQPLVEDYRNVGPVIKTTQGKMVEPRLMQLHFNKYILQCHLDKANFHTLRHTFATRCIEAGFDVKTLSEILGHTDVKTTLNRYVHSSYDLKQSNMDKLKPMVIS